MRLRRNDFMTRDIIEHEPEILHPKVDGSRDSGKTATDPDMDGISIEIIKDGQTDRHADRKRLFDPNTMFFNHDSKIRPEPILHNNRKKI